MKIFETFKCSGQNLSNSLCQFWNDKSIPLQILYPSSVSWKITPLYFFSSNNIYFGQKEPIKVNIFETFECSDQNLSNFLCQFWNNNSIPLQILYPSSVSWKITPMYFFSSNNVYFAQKEHIKRKISVKVLVLKFIKFLISILKWQANFSSNFASFFIVMTDNFSVNFKLIFFLLWIEVSHQSPNFETFKCFGENLPYSCHFCKTTSQFFFKFCVTLQYHER